MLEELLTKFQTEYISHVNITDDVSGEIVVLKLDLFKTYLTFTVQFSRRCPKVVIEQYVQTIFTEVNKQKHALLNFQKDGKPVSVIRFAPEYFNNSDWILAYRSNLKYHAMPNALDNLTDKTGWLINSTESVACFGLVDIVVSCRFTTAQGVQRVESIKFWVKSCSTIADLRHEMLVSGLIDIDEFNVGDIMSIAPPDEVLSCETLIADVVTTVGIEDDLKCDLGPDDFILM